MPEVVKGMDDLLRKLGDLQLTEAKKVIARALRKAGAPIARRAGELAPVDTGRLRAEQLITVREQSATEAILRVGPSRRAFYGLFQELGSAHHSPQPFLKRAFDETKDEAEQIIRESILEHIEDAAR